MDFLKKIKYFGTLFIILVITFLAFSPSLKNGFVNWDDEAYVTNNPSIKSFSLGNLKKISTSFFIGHYQPLTILSFASTYHFFKQDPFGYHLTSLCLHIVNTALVAWFIFMISANASVALLTALLFGIHPMHVESVAWISERKDVLYSLFFLGALISYLYYLRKGRLNYAYCISLVLFLASLLSKAMAITLPLVLFLLDYLAGRKKNKESWMDKVPFFAIAFLFAYMALFAAFESRSVSSESFNLLSFFIIACFVLVFYVAKLILPFGLCNLYPYSGSGLNALPLIYFLAPVLVVACGLLLLFVFKTRKKVVFGVLFYVVILLPVLQFVPMGSIIVADRYTYIASIGLFYIFSLCFIMLRTRVRVTKNRKAHFFLLVFLSCLIAGNFSLTFERCKVWKDSVTLWNDAIKNNPSAINAATIYNNYGRALQERGDRERSNLAFKKALSIQPRHYFALVNLGNLASEAGDQESAIKFFKRAVESEPAKPNAYLNLCVAYDRQGLFDPALEFCQKAIENKPDFAEAFAVLGVLYYRWNKMEAAEQCFKRVIEINPDLGIGYRHLGAIYLSCGRNEEALRLFKKAVLTDPLDVENYNNLGVGYARLGYNEEAAASFKKALALKPSVASYKNLTQMYLKMKKYELAARTYKEAEQLGLHDESTGEKIRTVFKTQGSSKKDAHE